MLNSVTSTVGKTVDASRSVVEGGVVKMRSFLSELLSAAASHPFPSVSSDFYVYDQSHDQEDDDEDDGIYDFLLSSFLLRFILQS